MTKITPKTKEEMLQYNVVFTSEPEGGYTVTVPSLPGCITYGETLGEAKFMAQDAIGLYLGSLVEDGIEIPNDNNSVVSSVMSSFPVQVLHTNSIRERIYA